MIRQANADDAAQILNIYRFYVEQTAISFEEKLPDLTQMRLRIEGILSIYPWLVYEEEGHILGYAYASSYRARPAYRWTVEVSVYLSNSAKGRGIATVLYHKLIALLVIQGFYSAIAVITEPNPESIGFHQHMGFEMIGVFKKVGYKLGAWQDLGWWQKELQLQPENPSTPIYFSELQQSQVTMILKGSVA